MAPGCVAGQANLLPGRSCLVASPRLNSSCPWLLFDDWGHSKLKGLEVSKELKLMQAWVFVRTGADLFLRVLMLGGGVGGVVGVVGWVYSNRDQAVLMLNMMLGSFFVGVGNDGGFRGG